MTEQLLQLIDNCNLHERVQRRLELNLCVTKEDIQALLEENRKLKNQITK